MVFTLFTFLTLDFGFEKLLGLSSLLINDDVMETSSGASLFIRALEVCSSIAFLPWPSAGAVVVDETKRETSYNDSYHHMIQSD